MSEPRSEYPEGGRAARLDAARFPAAARLLADAFYTNPAHVYLCPDARRRRAQLEWLLGGNLRLQPDLSASFCLGAGHDVDAMGFWTNSERPRPSLVAKLRAGLAAAPLRIGWDGLARVLEVTSAMDATTASLMRGRPHWYLNNFVVREELRGTGVGGRLLAAQLAKVGEKEPRHAFALTTQRPENLVFYRRFGFEVRHEQPLGRGPARFVNWTMVREPGLF